MPWWWRVRQIAWHWWQHRIFAGRNRLSWKKEEKKIGNGKLMMRFRSTFDVCKWPYGPKGPLVRWWDALQVSMCRNKLEFSRLPALLAIGSVVDGCHVDKNAVRKSGTQSYQPNEADCYATCWHFHARPERVEDDEETVDCNRRQCQRWYVHRRPLSIWN